MEGFDAEISSNLPLGAAFDQDELILRTPDHAGAVAHFAIKQGAAALVTLLGLDRRKLAVERNLEIVPRSTFGATALAEGDRIEIVAFVGGG